jgi:uncharacterized protein (TIGR03067 family)
MGPLEITMPVAATWFTPLRACLVFVACACLTEASAATRQNPQTGRTELEGVWEGVYSITDGKRLDLAPGRVRLVFRGEVLLAKGLVTPDEREVRYTVNSATYPKQLDYADLTRTKPCIYEIAAQRLRIAVPVDFTRPKEFPAASTKTVVVLVLKRGSE